MVKILAALVAALSILNSSGASPGATEKVAALVTALKITLEKYLRSAPWHIYCISSGFDDKIALEKHLRSAPGHIYCISSGFDDKITLEKHLRSAPGLQFIGLIVC